MSAHFSSQPTPPPLPGFAGSAGTTMSSLEISELVESNHSDVKRSIERLMGKGVVRDQPLANLERVNNLGLPATTKVYNLGKRDSYVVVAQLSPEFTGRLVDRWQELEAKEAKQQPPPMTQVEMIAGSARLILESAQVMAELERRQLAIEAAQEQQEQFNEEVEEKLGKIEVSTRNGVPEGFLSKKMARRKYNLGFSKDIFDTIMTVMKVTQQTYLHNENGHTTFTIAWKEDEIPNSVLAFRASITQETKTLCSSSLLHGQRFRYSLDKPTLQ